MEEGTEGALLQAKIHRRRCNVSPLRGKKSSKLASVPTLCAARNVAGNEYYILRSFAV